MSNTQLSLSEQALLEQLGLVTTKNLELSKNKPKAQFQHIFFRAEVMQVELFLKGFLIIVIPSSVLSSYGIKEC